MSVELTSEFDQVHLSAHSLANQLADVAAMMTAQGLVPPADLQEKIGVHLEQEKRFRLNLEESARRCHLDFSENLHQVPFAQLKTILDATNSVNLAKKRLEKLRAELDASHCNPELKRGLYTELSNIDSLLRQPKLPLLEQIHRFAEGKDHLAEKVEKLVRVPVVERQPVIDVPPTDFPAKKKEDSEKIKPTSSPAKTPSTVQDWLLTGNVLSEKITAEDTELGLDTSLPLDPVSNSGATPSFASSAPETPVLPESETVDSVVEEVIEAEETPVEEVAAKEVAEDLIFDDIDDVKPESATKQILTAQEINERLDKLNTEAKIQLEEKKLTGFHPSIPQEVAQTGIVGSEGITTESDSIFDEFDSPGQEIKESLTEQVRRESQLSGLELNSQTSSGSSQSAADFSEFQFVPQTDYSQVKEYAEKAANAQNRFDRVSFLSRLTWELISLGEYSWAYQVSRSLYANMDDDLAIPAPAPWLISLLTMGDHVRLSSGRIAREFNVIANEHCEEAASIASVPDSPEAFLLRAALMRGTVTTASSTCSDILRSYSIEPQQTQIYNYCSRVASFATKATGLKLDQYFYRPGAASIESDARSIRSQVISWKSRVLGKILPCRVTTPLFSIAHWSVRSSQTIRRPDLVSEWRARQILQARIVRLLQPIVDNQLMGGAVVEQEIRKLSHSVLLTETGTQAILSPTDSVEIFGAEVYNFVQEAVEFASHWLVLTAAYPGMESVLVPQEVNELRDEIDSRQNAVFLELKQLEKTHSSQAYRAALTACRRSMDRINQLFHPTEEPRISEVDHYCLLNAELLKIPGVTLDEDWQCRISPSTLEHQFLTVMKHGVVSWDDAFEMQLKAGCYRAAYQLLKLDIWSDEKREQLQEQLESRRNENADSLYELANQIYAKIEESKNLEILSPMESGKLSSQLAVIKQRIPTEYRLDQLRSDLTQLWQLLETRKELELKRMQERMSRLAGQQPSSPEDSNVGIDPQTPGKTEESGSQYNLDDDSSDGWAIDV